MEQNDLLSMSYGLTMSDVENVHRRFTRSQSARDAFGYTDFARLDADATSELLISVAYIASLIGYRRDEPWRLPGATPGSADGMKIVEQLDEIRERMLELATSSRRYIGHYSTTRRAKIAAATLILALDGCETRYAPFYMQFAGIRPGSRDPQGDAQQRAEDHFGDPAVNIFTGKEE